MPYFNTLLSIWFCIFYFSRSTNGFVIFNCTHVFMAKIQYVTIRGVELCLFKLTCDVLFYHLVFSPHMVLEATVFGFVF